VTVRTRYPLLLVVASLLPAAAVAQRSAAPTVRASFYVIAHTVVGTVDTAIAERATRTPTHLEGEFVDRAGGGRIAYAADLGAGGLVTRLEQWFYKATADTVAAQHAVFQFVRDSVIAETRGAPVRLPLTPGAIPYINPSAAFLEQILMRARALGGAGATIPLFITAGAHVVPAKVRWVGADSATLQLGGVTMRFALAADGTLLGGAIPGQGTTIVRTAPAATLAAAGPDYSAPPGAPYTAEDVLVTAPGGVHLAGTLTVPRARPHGRVPAVVTITGSGAEDRDEGSVALHGYRLFGELADTLGRRGIAELRLDDRGVGGSDAGPPGATLADEASDIRAAIAFLRARPEIDGARIAIVGHSEGGIVGPMVADDDSLLRALVIMAGPAEPVRALLRFQQEFVVDSVAHLTGAARAAALAQYTRNTDSLARMSPGFANEIALDPATYLRGVRQPVLIVQGEKDYQVPMAQAQEAAALLRAAGNRDVTVKLFPATNHLFVPDENAGFNYGKLTSMRVRPEVLGTIADWLSSRMK
jgi:hypothetical protein